MRFFPVCNPDPENVLPLHSLQTAETGAQASPVQGIPVKCGTELCRIPLTVS